MIFLLLFSKSVNASSRTLVRLLIYLCAVLFFVATVFFIFQLYSAMEQLYGGMEQSELVFSGEILFALFLLSTLLLMFGGDAVRMIRKDLDAAEIAFQAWVKEKEKGKQRFVLKKFAVGLVAGLPLMLLMARPAVRVGAGISALVIAGLIVMGIWLAIVINVWRLNIKYQDDVYRLLRRQT